MKKVALVGTAQTSCHLAPYDDESWDIWNIARNFTMGKRFTRWFEIHDLETLRAAGVAPEYLDFLKASGDRVVCGRPQPELPEAKPYPLAEVMEAFSIGGDDGRYFTSTAAYMIALAIHERADEIGVWGVDMLEAGEYAHQRSCCEYYLGIARGKGIKVTVAPQSPLLRCNYMYAFDNQKLSREMTERMAEMNRARQRLGEESARIGNERLALDAQYGLLMDIIHRNGL